MTPKQSIVDLAAELVRRHRLTASDLVVEVSSGDGLFLQALQNLGPRAVGIEREAKTLTRAWAAGADTIAACFGPGVADSIRRRYGPAKLVVTRVPQGAGEQMQHFLSDAARCLAPGGAIALYSAGINAVVDVRPGAIGYTGTDVVSLSHRTLRP